MVDLEPCPVCGQMRARVSQAMHLMDLHGYTYQRAMDWLRFKEELIEYKRGA
jgi:hypothetical protein